jgi:hypothetical protein
MALSAGSDHSWVDGYYFLLDKEEHGEQREQGGWGGGLMYHKRGKPACKNKERFGSD